MRETFKSITENTPVSVSLILALFGILTTLIGAVMIGYNMLLEVKYGSQINALAIQRLESRVSEVEKGQSVVQSMATDIAVIKSKVEDMQKNLPMRKN